MDKNTNCRSCKAPVAKKYWQYDTDIDNYPYRWLCDKCAQAEGYCLNCGEYCGASIEHTTMCETCYEEIANNDPLPASQWMYGRKQFHGLVP